MILIKGQKIVNSLPCMCKQLRLQKDFIATSKTMLQRKVSIWKTDFIRFGLKWHRDNFFNREKIAEYF